MHIHHIKPKHMGGSDDPSNLIERTVAQHAEDHRLLFVKYGHWQDEVAWKGLAGLITHEEAARLASQNANLGKKHTEKTKKKQSEKKKGKGNHMFGKSGTMLGKTGEKSHMTGKKLSEETKKKMSLAHIDNPVKYWLGKFGKDHPNFGTHYNLGKHYNQGKQKIVPCPYCEKSGGVAVMHRWHFENCKLRRL